MFNTSFFKKFKFWGVEDYTPNQPQETLDSIEYFFHNQIKPVVKNEYRLGMWVRTTQGKPAIVYRIESDGLIVHHVDNQTGETVDEMKVSYNDVRQCKYLEIPEVRRGFTKKTAKELGYGS